MAFYCPGPGRNRLFLFTLSTCAHCRAAKKLLAGLKEPFDYVDVDLLPAPEMEQALAEVARYNPGQSFPTVLAGSRVVAGPLRGDLRRAAARLADAR
ncbi:hypothetical protein FACS189460_1690 [Deltaproteobacteria bacterium]|nr:hypothetical protein FACS189460_1690 [Deltaproteobacteria bacterium]